MPDRATPRSATLGSVANAARVLKSFTAHDPVWGVTDMARHLGIAKSTAYRLLATLTEQGLLDQDPLTGRYRLGLVVFDLAAAVQSFDLHEAALTAMSDLRNRTGETVQVAVLDGREVVYVERLDSHHTLKVFLDVGRRNWINCTSTGKVLLAFASPQVQERTLRGWQLPSRTPFTITDPAAFRAELAQVKRVGFAANRQESALEVISVAAPIRRVSGQVVAALSVAGPIDRMGPHEMTFAQAVVQSAAAISRRLGYRRSAGAA